MTTSMYKKICITNRYLVSASGEETAFLKQVAYVAAKRPDGIILREKDLSEEGYIELAEKVQKICKEYKVPCIFHTYANAVIQLNGDGVHLPYASFLGLQDDMRQNIPCVGVSVHSKQEAIVAQQRGASYVTAGHIFETDCKKGVPPKGLAYLQEICQSVSIPVYAIGGICDENAKECINAGASGVCMMSQYMKEH